MQVGGRLRQDRRGSTVGTVDVKPELFAPAQICQFRQRVYHAGADAAAGTDDEKRQAAVAAICFDLVAQQVHADAAVLIRCNPSNAPGAQPADVGRLVDEVIARFGRIDILVNNAGITRDNLLMRMKDAEWDGIIATNLTSVYRLSKACLRAMTKARKGRIVNISSVVGATGNAGQTNYAAAKAGMVGFTKALAREVGSRGITVNCVAPGFIDTDMTRGLDDKTKESLLTQVPLGRLGLVEDVAAAVRFLVGDHASYITGITLNVNGGMAM